MLYYPEIIQIHVHLVHTTEKIQHEDRHRPLCGLAHGRGSSLCPLRRRPALGCRGRMSTPRAHVFCLRSRFSLKETTPLGEITDSRTGAHAGLSLETVEGPEVKMCSDHREVRGSHGGTCSQPQSIPTAGAAASQSRQFQTKYPSVYVDINKSSGVSIIDK